MADDFDPYYTWLGIPPDEQPASHYRLLGVRELEPNLDVISNAGDQRMAFLRTFQVGKRSALSQRLLNELAAAKGCLLEPARRRVYDEKLKASQAKALAPVPQPAPSYSHVPAALAMTVRQPPVAGSLPSAAPLPSKTPDPLAPVDPFADLVREAQWQAPLPAKPAAGSGADFTEQVTALARSAISLVQESPLAAAAYGVLALGILMLLGVGLWVTLGTRSHSRPVAAIPPTDTGLPKASDVTPPPKPAPAAEKRPVPATSSSANPAASPSPSPAAVVPAKPLPAPMPSRPSDSEDGPAESAPEAAATSGRAWTPLMNVFPGKFPQPRKAKLSKGSSKLAEFAVDSKELRVWSVPANTGQQFESPLTISAPSSVQCVCFSRDDALLAIGTQSDVEIWDLRTQEHWQVAVPANVVDIVFCGDEKYLGVALQGRPLELINLGTRQITLRMASKQAEARSLAASDQWLAALTPRGDVSIYNVRRGAAHGDFHSGRGAIKAIFMRGGSLYAVDDESITTWAVEERLVSAEWRTPILESHPQPDDLEVETGLFTQQENGVLTLFQWVNDSPLGKIAIPPDKFPIVDIGLDRLLTSGPEDRLLLWNLDRIKQSSGLLNPAEEIAVFSRLPRGSVAAILGPKPSPLPAVPASSSSPTPLPSGSSSMTPAQAAARLRAIGVTIYTPDPKDADYVAFQNCKFTDDDIRCLAALPRLRTVSFQNVAVTGQTLKCLQNCRGLESIQLPKSDLGDEDLAHLAPLTRLTSLSAVETKVTADCLESLKGLTNLELLMLPQSLGRELIPYLANYPKLKHFHPIPHNLTDKDMKVIGSLRRLEYLDLQTSKLTLEGYKPLANLTEVKNINLPSHIPPGAMGHLSRMKLEYLSFPESTTIDEMRLFQGMTTLRFVGVSKSVTDEGLQLIAGFTSVESVALTDASLVTPAGIAHVATMKSLKWVTIPYHMGDEGLAKLTGCQSLVELSMDDTSGITSSGLKMLGSLPKLERLRLPRSCDDQGLEAVAECRNLKWLSIRQSAVTAKGFQKLQELKKLEELNLSSLKLTTEQLDILKSMTHLKSLTLIQCTLPAGDGSDLKTALPNVRVNIH